MTPELGIPETGASSFIHLRIAKVLVQSAHCCGHATPGENKESLHHNGFVST